MTYFEHIALNWRVAGRCWVMFLFHFLHGLFPLRITEHDFWGIEGNKGGV